MEDDWPLTSWPFPTRADALAQALGLCPHTASLSTWVSRHFLYVCSRATWEKPHPSQEAPSLHLSLEQPLAFQLCADSSLLLLGGTWLFSIITWGVCGEGERVCDL